MKHKSDNPLVLAHACYQQGWLARAFFYLIEHCNSRSAQVLSNGDRLVFVVCYLQLPFLLSLEWLEGVLRPASTLFWLCRVKDAVFHRDFTNLAGLLEEQPEPLADDRLALFLFSARMSFLAHQGELEAMDQRIHGYGLKYPLRVRRRLQLYVYFQVHKAVRHLPDEIRSRLLEAAPGRSASEEGIYHASMLYRLFVSQGDDKTAFAFIQQALKACRQLNKQQEFLFCFDDYFHLCLRVGNTHYLEPFYSELKQQAAHNAVIGSLLGYYDWCSRLYLSGDATTEQALRIIHQMRVHGHLDYMLRLALYGRALGAPSAQLAACCPEAGLFQESGHIARVYQGENAAIGRVPLRRDIKLYALTRLLDGSVRPPRAGTPEMALDTLKQLLKQKEYAYFRGMYVYFALREALRAGDNRRIALCVRPLDTLRNTAFAPVGARLESLFFDLATHFGRCVPVRDTDAPAPEEIDSSRPRRESAADDADAGGEEIEELAAIKGRSNYIHRLKQKLPRIAANPFAVLITGETGTGKELIARALHRLSGRKGKFVVINCSAIPENLFESELFGFTKGAFSGANYAKKGLLHVADKGVLFLDEVGELSYPLQAKLLRFLQEGEIMPIGATAPVLVDVKIVAATNIALSEAVEQRAFRRDLFQRLSVFHLQVLPLRNRKEDISLLFDLFVAKYARDFTVGAVQADEEVYRLLTAYHWPGNVRELENEALRLLADIGPGGRIRAEHLSTRLQTHRHRPARMQHKPSQDQILSTYFQQGRNVSQTARLLGISRQWLYKVLKRKGLK